MKAVPGVVVFAPLFKLVERMKEKIISFKLSLKDNFTRQPAYQ
jgi:hypothetical protein